MAETRDAEDGDSPANQVQHYIQSLEKERKGRLAVHVQLSRLRPQNRTENQLRVACDAFETLSRKYRGRLFLLNNGDIVFFCQGAKISDVDPVTERLRYLFNDDPLFVGAGAGDSTRFCTWYNLVTEFRAFQSRVNQLARSEQVGAERTRQEEAEKRALNEGEQKDIEPRHLQSVEDALAKADVTDYVRRQAICLITPDNQFRPVFSELFVGIGDLNRTLLAGVNITSNRWLFQYLTNLLDRRMLSFLGRTKDPSYGKAISININVASLLSQEFKEFDDKVPERFKKTIMFEMQAVDVYSDMGAFVFARDTWQERGYRFCLDGLSHLTLPLVDRRALGLDLLKINWAKDMIEDESGKLAQRMQQLVSGAVASRVIFARCETEESVLFGRQLGISLFQGRLIDKVVRNQQKKAAQAAGQAPVSPGH